MYVFGIGGVCVGVVLVVAGVTGEIFWFSVFCVVYVICKLFREDRWVFNGGHDI